MQPSNAERPVPARPGNGPQKTSCLGADGCNPTKSSSRTQEAIAGLKREFVAECLRIAALKASHGADNIEIGDDLAGERDIRIAVENVREAARAFRELRLLEAGSQS